MYLIEAEVDGVGKLTATVDGRDIRQWESQTGMSFLLEDFSYTILTELARLALARSGQLQMSATEFNEACGSVREVSREPLDPTQTAHTDEP